ncbi:hypothetical protein AURDEDRAFT_128569 [Auricularia subglabra TFB-10046 SS5]|nr:hypothetical protein AURDEDRAFT_128569 [Auricularia subglabra TFB-10046 SS5]
MRVVKEGEDPVLGRSVHIMTVRELVLQNFVLLTLCQGVELAHAAGFKGKGIQVAILDTGVDYNHPSLGGGFGPGFKIEGGADLVGDDYDGNNTPVPDDDPMDCYGHGTTAVIKETFVTNVPHDPFKYVTLAYPSYPGVPADVPSTPLPVLALKPFPDGTATSDCTDPSDLPSDIPKDLSGMAIVLYGSDNFECPVLEFVQMRNPTVILNYKNRYTVFGVSFPSILISDEDGFWLAEQAKSGNLTVTFPGPPLEDSTGAAGGLVNDFSSMGPENAPGGDIMSTIMGGRFAVESGTSMSAPYAAGSAALLLQAKGKDAAADVRTLLQTTSQAVSSSGADGALPQTLARQGAGLVNVFAAINAASRISPAQITLKDRSQGWDDTYSITIHNDGKESQTYKLGHVAAGTTVTKPANESEISLGPGTLVSAPAAVSFSKDSVTVSPGSSATVVLQFSAPANADARTLPLVSGWITATSADGVVLKSSYIGMAADFSTAQTLSTSSRFTAGAAVLPAIHRGPEGFQKGPANYSIKRETIMPLLYFGVSVPTTRLLVDLISADTKISGTTGANARRTWSDWLPSVPGSHRVSASAAAFPSIGPIALFNDMLRSARPRPREVPRVELAAFANGTRFPEGQYRAVIRALRPFGNPDNVEDWDVQVSEQFGWIP